MGGYSFPIPYPLDQLTLYPLLDQNPLPLQRLVLGACGASP